MRKFGTFVLLSLVVLGACSKKDPILPGTRESIFPGAVLTVEGKQVPNLPDNAPVRTVVDCPYTQDTSNIVWYGKKKLFSGYPTNNSVKSDQKPVCSGKFVYAGLTTGELVKVDSTNRNIAWIADIYRQSNLTGGATVLDILAPIVVDKDVVYVGGLGDAFCKLQASKGAKIWCLEIGVAEPFLIMDALAFVVGTNNTLYAINTNNGDIYWGTKIKTQAEPKYANKIITVGNQKINAVDGKIIK